MKRTVDELAHEIDCVSVTLSAIAYATNGNFTTEVDLTQSSISDILFGICNHLDRIVADLENPEQL